MFKRFRKKEAEKTEETSNNDENSGFICPSCYWGFLTAEDLQSHWDTEHAELPATQNQPKNTSAIVKNGQDSAKIWNEHTGSLLSFDDESLGKNSEDISLLDTTLKDLEEKSTEVVALQREINDINAALKEEKWYSSALKEEVDRLESEKQERLEAYQILEQEKHKSLKEHEEKFSLFEQQKIAEIDALKESLVHALEAKSGSQEEQLSLAQRSSQMNSEIVVLQSRLKDEEQKRLELENCFEGVQKELEEKVQAIGEFEKELGQRPSTDHVLSLQTHIQSLQDQLKLMKAEKESEKLELSEKYQNSVETSKRLEAKVNELVIEKSSKVEQLQSLQTALEAASDYRKQVEENQGEKQQLVLSMEHELNQTRVSIKEKEQFVEFLQKQLEEVKGNYQNELNAKDEANHEVRRLQNICEEQERQNNAKESKLVEVEKSLHQSKADISRMEEERNDLIQKIEFGDGVNTAINQLHQEKDHLEEKLKDYEKQLEVQAKESEVKMEELHKRNNEIIEELEQLRLKENKLSVLLKEKADEVEILAQTLEEVRSELQIKSESLVAIEASKVAEKNVLEEQRLTAQENLQQKIAEHSALQRELVLIKENLSSCQEESISLQSQMASMQSEVDDKSKLCRELQTQLNAKTCSLDVLIEEKQDIACKLEVATSEMNTLRGKHEQILTENAAEVASLEQNKLQLDVKLETLSKSFKEKEEEFTLLQTTLTKVAEEKGVLQEKLEANMKILESTMTKLEEKSKEFEVTKESLQTAACSKESELKTQLSDLKLSLKSVKEKLDAALLKVEEKVAEIDNLQSEISKVEQEKTSLQEDIAKEIKLREEEVHKYQLKLKENEERVEKTTIECHELLEKKDGQLQELRQKVESQEQQLQRPCESCLDYDRKLCRLQEILNEEKLLLAEKEKEALTIQEENVRLSGHVEQLEKQKEKIVLEMQEIEARNQEEITRIKEEKFNIESKVAEGLDRLGTVEASHDKLVKQNENLQEKLDMKDETLREVEDAKLTLETQHASMKKELADVKEEKQKLIEEMAQRENLLIKQKLEVEKEVERLETSLTKAKEDLDEHKEASKRAQNVVKNEMESLSEKLKLEKETGEQLQLKLDDTEARLNTKLAAANENLLSARNEVTKYEQKLREFEGDLKTRESQHFELKGEIAVLEATIENNHDEKRSLLERCIASEETCKKYQKTIEQLNKNIEELNSAMIELGQENQNLQVVQNIRNNRKWEKDSEVLQCPGCAKKFSVSVRKHHCRNCGSIFCGECTGKTATVAGSKKPARVCDPCYNELNVPVRSYSLNSSNT